MNKEEIKEYLNRVEKLELKLDGKDKETFQWLIYGYNQCAKLLNENEQQNQKYKEVIDKAIEYIKERFYFNEENGEYSLLHTFDKCNVKELLDILNEVSE